MAAGAEPLRRIGTSSAPLAHGFWYLMIHGVPPRHANYAQITHVVKTLFRLYLPKFFILTNNIDVFPLSNFYNTYYQGI